MSRNKESFAEKVLNILGEKSREFLDESLKMIFDPAEFIKTYGFVLYGNPTPARVSYALRRSPYFKREGKKFYVTEKGRIRIIKNIIKKRSGEEEKFRGVWFGIIFDIPEAKRRDRSFLRRELRTMGCRELQHSVWITPFDIEKEMLVLIKLWRKDFAGDIRFLKISKISGEAEIEKRFKLS